MSGSRRSAQASGAAERRLVVSGRSDSGASMSGPGMAAYLNVIRGLG